MDLPILTAGHYHEALQLFLRNPSVQDALQAPLDGHTALDGDLLAGIRAEFRTNNGENLIELWNTPSLESAQEIAAHATLILAVNSI